MRVFEVVFKQRNCGSLKEFFIFIQKCSFGSPSNPSILRPNILESPVAAVLYACSTVYKNPESTAAHAFNLLPRY